MKPKPAIDTIIADENVFMSMRIINIKRIIGLLLSPSNPWKPESHFIWVKVDSWPVPKKKQPWNKTNTIILLIGSSWLEFSTKI